VGQQIEIKSSVVLGNMLVIDTNRTLTGQNGEAYASLDDAVGPTLPAELAGSLFSSLGDVDHVFTASNSISVRAKQAWSEPDVAIANATVRNFFTYWDDNQT
jgi:hypothetical protein